MHAPVSVVRVVVVADQFGGGGVLVATEDHFEATLSFLLKLRVECFAVCVSEARGIFVLERGFRPDICGSHPATCT